MNSSIDVYPNCETDGSVEESRGRPGFRGVRYPPPPDEPAIASWKVEEDSAYWEALHDHWTKRREQLLTGKFRVKSPFRSGNSSPRSHALSTSRATVGHSLSPRSSSDDPLELSLRTIPFPHRLSDQPPPPAMLELPSTRSGSTSPMTEVESEVKNGQRYSPVARKDAAVECEVIAPRREHSPRREVEWGEHRVVERQTPPLAPRANEESWAALAMTCMRNEFLNQQQTILSKVEAVQKSMEDSLREVKRKVEKPRKGKSDDGRASPGSSSCTSSKSMVSVSYSSASKTRSPFSPPKRTTAPPPAKKAVEKKGVKKPEPSQKPSRKPQAPDVSSTSMCDNSPVHLSITSSPEAVHHGDASPYSVVTEEDPEIKVTEMRCEAIKGRIHALSGTVHKQQKLRESNSRLDEIESTVKLLEERVTKIRPQNDTSKMSDAAVGTEPLVLAEDARTTTPEKYIGDLKNSVAYDRALWNIDNLAKSPKIEIMKIDEEESKQQKCKELIDKIIRNGISTPVTAEDDDVAHRKSRSGSERRSRCENLSPVSLSSLPSSGVSSALSSCNKAKEIKAQLEVQKQLFDQRIRTFMTNLDDRISLQRSSPAPSAGMEELLGKINEHLLHSPHLPFPHTRVHSAMSKPYSDYGSYPMRADHMQGAHPSASPPFPTVASMRENALYSAQTHKNGFNTYDLTLAAAAAAASAAANAALQSQLRSQQESPPYLNPYLQQGAEFYHPQYMLPQGQQAYPQHRTPHTSAADVLPFPKPEMMDPQHFLARGGGYSAGGKPLTYSPIVSHAVVRKKKERTYTEQYNKRRQ